MQRKHIPGISDEALVTAPDQIRIISNDQRFDRDFVEPVSLRDCNFLRNMLRTFSVNGHRFPTMLPRTNPTRAAAQDRLWSNLNLKAKEIKPGPATLEPLAQWVRGTGASSRSGRSFNKAWGGYLLKTSPARTKVGPLPA
jgi:hypothetical protein